MEYYSVIKRNEISIYAPTWMDLEKIICEGKSDTGQIFYESLCMKYLYGTGVRGEWDLLVNGQFQFGKIKKFWV